MAFCLFAIGPSASVSNSADRLMPLNQLLTERSDERHSPQKSAFKTTPLFFVQGIARGNVSSAFPHELSVTAGKNIYRLLHAARAPVGTSLPISFCSGVDAGNALAKDLPSAQTRSAPLRLSCSLAAGCVSASTLLVAMAMQHIFAQSLLRMGSAKWKTLKQVMFEKKSLRLFMALYA